MLSEREQYYDDVIAPKLKEIAQLCQDKGLALICQVEWEPGETGRTVTLPPGSSWQIRMAETAMRCRGNIDTLFIALAKYAREHGHSSVVLQQMGVPTDPDTETEEKTDGG